MEPLLHSGCRGLVGYSKQQPTPAGEPDLVLGPNRSLRVIFDLPLTAKWGEPEPKAEICHGR